MSDSSWKKKLTDLLTWPSRASEGQPRLALVGIGSELHGDDAAGAALIQRLGPLISGHEHVLAVEAGVVPENASGPLRRFQPALVLLIDAGDFGGSPGEVRVLDWRAAQGFSASTHSLPLSTFAGYLESELGCRVALLAIQAGQVEFGQGMSPQVERAVEALVEQLTQNLSHLFDM